MTEDIRVKLGDVGAALERTGRGAGQFFVLDKRVCELYADSLALPLRADNHMICEAVEGNKSLEQTARIWDALLERRYTKKDILVYIGGGIIGDLAGYAACCYKRGMRLFSIPTTLLSMVDSSIGSKTAINHRSVKNSIGCYYEAEKRFLCYDFLKTLPGEELLCGLAEMIKIAAVYDRELFEAIEEGGALAALDRTCIERAMELKNDIVSRDPYEKGLRKILNFGHTVGHALEAYMLDRGEGEVKHGHAVAYGMLTEMELGRSKGLVSEEVARRLRALIENSGFHLSGDVDMVTLLPYMRNDKKNAGRELSFALLRDLGRAELIELSEEEVLKSR